MKKQTNYKKKSSSRNATMLLDTQTPFAVREAFNQLRTNLMYTIPEQDRCPIFAITSANEGEGKSNVIANIALSFTQISKKVLLIDADMRCPSQFRIFDMERQSAGLSELISGIQTDVIHKDVKPGLDLILSGRTPPNPSELIAGPRFADYLTEWSKEYDVIFVDLPPVGIVTDAMAISKSVSGYLFTIRSERESSKKIRMAIDSMEQVGAKIVGVILNDYNLRGNKRYQSKTRYNQTVSRYAVSANEAMKQENDKDASQ